MLWIGGEIPEWIYDTLANGNLAAQSGKKKKKETHGRPDEIQRHEIMTFLFARAWIYGLVWNQTKVSNL